MEKLNAEQFGYLAGLIDAECSIQLQYRRHRATISGKEYVYNGYSLYLDMSNTNKDLILWCKENVGGSWGRKKHDNIKWKDQYYWRLSGKSTIALLKKVVHLLIDKRERALLAISFPLSHKHKRDLDLKENLYLKMKELNQRGK
jgi:hypothetical protein